MSIQNELCEAVDFIRSLDPKTPHTCESLAESEKSISKALIKAREIISAMMTNRLTVIPKASAKATAAPAPSAPVTAPKAPTPPASPQNFEGPGGIERKIAAGIAEARAALVSTVDRLAAQTKGSRLGECLSIYRAHLDVPPHLKNQSFLANRAEIKIASEALRAEARNS